MEIHMSFPFFPRRPLHAVSLTLLLALGSNAQADENSIKNSVEAYIGVPVVDAVRRVPQGGLYEVLLNTGEIIYTDETVSFIVDGRIIDTKTRQDITAARQEQLSTIDFSTLPLNQAVKRVNGNGKRIIVTFEDPNCTYCKHLGRELLKVKDVTLYTFLYPILPADSEAKSRAIWCAKDPGKSWNDWIVSAKAPQPAQCDSSVIDRNLALGQKLRINSTPTLFFADGSRISGYRDAAALEQKLTEAAQAR
jgi:thiol:disulfide interchange protein DsbC